MKNKKNTIYDRKLERQLDILSHYFNIDRENKIVDLILQTEKASDFLELDICSLKYPKFKTEVLARVSELMDSFPTGYKVNLILKIDDYESYDPDTLLSSLKDALEMFHYTIYRVKHKNWFVSASLIVISAIILFVRIFLVNNGTLDGSGLVNEMIDITAWAFLWEAVSILFLSSNDLEEITMKIGQRLLSISLRDKDGNDIRKLSRAEFVKEWINESKRETTGKILMVISGAACVVTGVMDIVNTSFDLYKCVTGGIQMSPVIFIVAYIAAILFVLGGIGIVSMFRGHGPMQKLVPFLAYIFFAYSLLIYVLLIFTFIQQGRFDFKILFDAIKSTLIAVIYFISYLFSRRNKKKQIVNI
ncbi:MAG: hypothetical protein MJ221_02945 [Bacilli bacterium]|nr:hypothetical protein [Bacilli bacterium]